MTPNYYGRKVLINPCMFTEGATETYKKQTLLIKEKNHLTLKILANEDFFSLLVHAVPYSLLQSDETTVKSLSFLGNQEFCLRVAALKLDRFEWMVPTDLSNLNKLK